MDWVEWRNVICCGVFEKGKAERKEEEEYFCVSLVVCPLYNQIISVTVHKRMHNMCACLFCCPEHQRVLPSFKMNISAECGREIFGRFTFMRDGLKLL